MATHVVVLPDADAVGAALAQHLLHAMQATWRRGHRFVLGCPGGRSLRPTYRGLAQAVSAGAGEPGDVLVVMMDDYLVGAPQRPRRLASDSHASCERFAVEVIAAPLQAAGVRVEVWLPDPQEPEAYDERIAATGGVDVFLLASGASDGHVAFNPPDTPSDARTRVVELAQTTREDNLATFPEFRTVAAVPRFGVTVGPATIADHSRELAMVITGAHKQRAFQEIAAASAYDARWPATVVHAGPPATIYADQAAAQRT